MNGEILQLMLVPLGIYTAVITVLVGPIAWKLRKHASWQVWEVLTGLAPIVLWMGLILADGNGKSLSNLGAEPMYLALAVAAIAWVRAVFAPRLQPSRAAVYGALVALSAAWLIWWVVPSLPE